jgi:hypothetical protein
LHWILALRAPLSTGTRPFFWAAIPAISRDRVQVTTASGVEYAPRIRIESLEAIGEVRRDFPLLCHTLPPSAKVDGLLGLDFLRGKRLVIDFRTGTIELD